MKHKRTEQLPQTESVFLRAGYITLWALPYMNFTVKLSRYKKLFLLVAVHAYEWLNRVKCVQNIARVRLPCTFFPWSSAPSMSKHASKVQLLLLMNFARQWHLIVPMLSTKLREHRFVDVQNGLFRCHSHQCFVLCTCAIKEWRPCFSKWYSELQAVPNSLHYPLFFHLGHWIG